MTAKRFQLDSETIDLLQIIDSTEVEEDRSSAIFNLARRGGMDAARILIETFERSMWRSTKFTILKALGSVRHGRAVEFLCRIATDPEDLAMAGEAVLALGSTDDPVAGEFLASILRTPNHPLNRESLIALGHLNFFPCEGEISEILSRGRNQVAAPVLQNAVIAAGLKGYNRLLPAITGLLTREASGPLFNASLLTIGRIGNQRSLELLLELDTRYRAFAHQLKMTAMDQLRLRLGYTIEDAVAACLTADNPETMRQAWQVLGLFPEDSAREALQLLAGDTSIVFKALERTILFNKKNAAEDLQFLASHQADLPREIFAGLARKHAAHLTREDLLRILNQISDDFTVYFLGAVRVDRGSEVLIDFIERDKTNQSLKLSAINALVMQPIMSGGDSELRDSLGKRLVKLIERATDTQIASRMLRAIGQLRYFGPDAASLLRDSLKSGAYGVEGVYGALARIDTEDASRIITKRLRQIVASREHEAEVTAAVRGLADCTSGGDCSCLVQLPLDRLTDLKIPVLKILSGTEVPELTPFVESSLDDKDFQARLLAVVAAKKHQSRIIWERVFGFLDHENQSLCGRALDTIVTSGGAAEHLRIIKRLENFPEDRSFYEKVLRSMTPRVGDSYAEVLSAIEGLIQKRVGVLAEQDVFNHAVNLRDNLSLLMSLATGASKSSISAKEKHAIDEKLSRNLRGFSAYSETIKSVLRSGEVTWQHPELFDARVDKSTVLVQYVKSIDLLLQEKIGSAMFLSQGSTFLQKMQSRVVRLGLDEDSGFAGDLVADLDCSLYFSRDAFPAHKLALICRSVMSGMIMKEQYRAVDGLRAWALLLLIFGRTFKFRGQTLEPLLPLKKSGNDGICRIARAMNDLQEARNRAAHRGTMLEMDNMKETRDLCASLLNDLEAHLNPA